MLPRGIRNNNPLNIRRSKDQWQGMRREQTDPAGIGPDEPLGIPSESPARWIALGAAMAIQENGITSIDWFAMLQGWEMARGG